MSKLDKYKPFTVVSKVINQLEFQGLLKLVGNQEQIAELITQELIQAGVLREYINVDRPYPTNIHNSLEEFITEGGRVVFIDRMDFDANKSLFTLYLKFDPESERIDKTIIFQDIYNFEVTVEEEEDTINHVDSIIGLDQYSTKYVLKTEVREIIFSSLVAPKILLLKK